MTLDLSRHFLVQRLSHLTVELVLLNLVYAPLDCVAGPLVFRSVLRQLLQLVLVLRKL